MVPRESWEQVRREKGELEDVVRQKEKRLKRLQEVCFVSFPLCWFHFTFLPRIPSSPYPSLNPPFPLRYFVVLLSCYVVTSLHESPF